MRGPDFRRFRDMALAPKGGQPVDLLLRDRLGMYQSGGQCRWKNNRWESYPGGVPVHQSITVVGWDFPLVVKEKTSNEIETQEEPDTGTQGGGH